VPRVAKVRVSSFEYYNSSSSITTGVSSLKTQVSGIKNGLIRCFLLIQLKLETRVLILETLVFKLETGVLILETRYSIEHNTL